MMSLGLDSLRSRSFCIKVTFERFDIDSFHKNISYMLRLTECSSCCPSMEHEVREVR